MLKRLSLLLLLPVWLFASAQTGRPTYELNDFVSGLEMPWSIAFLPDGSFLVTELVGRLQHIAPNGKMREVGGLPEDIYVKGQGGLMDVVLHPDFARNNTLYLTYAKGNGDGNATAVMRAQFRNGRLTGQKDIFVATMPNKTTPAHYGGRMVFLGDRSFLLTLGDGFNYREQAQVLTNHFGKVVRLAADGSVPDDNPFVGRNDALPEIWTYGHRNPQAIVRDSQGRVFLNEHGARGGDELNLLEAGKNYGWPVITYSLNYTGSRISPWTERAGMEQPVLYWTPSPAFSGMTAYTGTLFPQWRGDVLLTALVSKDVVRVDMYGRKAKGQERLFGELDARLRDIRTAPDGSLYILAESNSGEPKSGRIVRVLPYR